MEVMDKGSGTSAEHTVIEHGGASKNPMAVYNTRRKKWAFWTGFLIFSVALAIATDTTFLYLSFATSSFSQNTLLSTIGLLTSVLSAVTQPFWGKLADRSERSISLLCSLVLFVTGYIICAAAPTITSLGAGQVIYTVG